jgi:proteic killer suppression protein
VEIEIATAKLQKTLATEHDRVCAYGPPAAKALGRRLTQLHAAQNLEVMRTLPGNCHELKGDRKGQLAVEVTKGLRVVFRPTEHPPPSRSDGGLDWSAVTAITVLEVTDYHG